MLFRSLQSAAFDRLLKKAREHYDYIILDAPALRSIVDGAVVARQVEGTVMVVSAQRTGARTVQAALDKLRMLGSTNLLGVVLNGVKPEAAQAGDYYMGVKKSIPLLQPATAG